MTDRRLLRSNGSVAHSSLEGRIKADRFTDGELRRVVHPVTTIRSTPGGSRDREVLFGAVIRVLEEDHQGGFAFGYAEQDGYVGYFDRAALGPCDDMPTHVVSARLTQALGVPNFKAETEHLPLSMGAQVHVVAIRGNWAEIAGPRFVPLVHLRRLDQPETDPVTVAERLLGTPYVWGGNSSLGIDCSGLVQAGCLACAIGCPGDSDLQEAAMGKTLPPETPPRRGDLLFWKGHVALVVNSGMLIHANAFHMAVAFEPLQDAIKRIAAQGGGPVTTMKRLRE